MEKQNPNKKPLPKTTFSFGNTQTSRITAIGSSKRPQPLDSSGNPITVSIMSPELDQQLEKCMTLDKPEDQTLLLAHDS